MTATPPIRLDADRHVYILSDGRKLMSLTTVLELAGFVPPYTGPKSAGLRGTHVHLACELLDKNDLDWDTVRPEIMGYVEAYADFLAKEKPQYVGIEEIVLRF